LQPRTKTLLKRLAWAGLALLALLGLFTLDALRHGGQFRELPAATPLDCETLPLAASAEDIQLDRARSVAFLSAFDRRALIEGGAPTGDILRLELPATKDAALPAPSSALAAKPAGFRPHGLSLYRMGDGALRLFAISHLPDGSHAVEIFEQRAVDGLFVPVRSVRDPLLRSPNAVVAVGPEQFYVANDSGAEGFLDRFAELARRRGLSRIVFFDGKDMTVAASGLASAVGLGMSPDGTRLYAAETLGKRLAVFERNAGTAALTRLADIPVDGAPDNINIDAEGDLWLAVHGRTLDLVRHFGDAAHPAPSWIQRLRHAAEEPRLETVFLDPGVRISAGSVGAVHDGRLLMGSITERKLLSCRLK
jgi:arylesterase/paraoxonase